MLPKQRLLCAIKREKPDRLPATTHHLMHYFLQKYMNGISNDEFFKTFDLDPIVWINNYKTDENHADEWVIKSEKLNDPQYNTCRVNIITPGGTLTMVLQSNNYTSWVSEHLIKNKKDIELIERYAVMRDCDVESVNAAAEKHGDTALIRGHIRCFDVFGQPGCWQDAACLVGIERLIIESYDDPVWVHELLNILFRMKESYIRSLKGAKYDILELGGGDASSTVISPKIFNNFVAPYDSKLIQLAHDMGQRIVYHTCGGMMPILDDLAAMGPDALETFTPPGMGGDVDLARAKKQIGDKVCMIGGFDQFHYFTGCTPEDTRKEVRRCFEAAGEGGGFILSPSDHFFDADVDLIKAFAEEAISCVYD